MLKVVHLCEKLVIGGISSILRDLLCEMKNHNFKSTVIYFYGESNYSDEIRKLGIGVESIGMKESLRMDPAGLVKLWSRLRQFKPDVVHCHGNYPLLAALLLRPFFRKVPVVFTYHGTIYRGRQKTFPIIIQALRRCNAVVAVSKDGAAALRNFIGSETPITIICNGVDPYRVETSKGFSQRQKRALLNFTDEEQIVLTVAQFKPSKDHKTLLQAFYNVKKAFPLARLYLVGDGSIRKEVEDMIDRLDLCDAVKLGGLRSDISELMAMADLLVLSSKIEGFPITLLEAAAAGLPFIATAVGGVSDIYEAGVPCLVVPRQNPLALYEAIALLLGNEGLRKNMSDQAKKAVRLHFNISLIAQQYAELYKNVIQQVKS
jgi:glycosyltransferase involved in cell wall biosynthesis